MANSGYVGGCRVNNTETGQYAGGRNGLLVPDYSGKIADESKFMMGGWFYKTVSVRLFAPSTLDWRERGVKLAQKTEFPYGERACVTVDAVGADPVFTLKVRRAKWADEGFAVYVNVERTTGDALAFRIKGRYMLLMPIFDLHYRRHIVYWPLR